MYYIKEGEKFSKSSLTPEDAITCGWSEWEDQSEKEKGLYVVVRSRYYYGEFNQDTLELYNPEAALSALEDAMKETKRQYDELLYQHLCILEEKASAELNSER